MAAEVITLNITPTGDMPVLHLAQYDTNRPFGIALKWGEDDYTLPEGITCELQMRKTDSNLVTITPTGSSQNVLEFECTEQMCTCPGKNIAQLALLDESDNVIHTLRFEIEVQRDVMQGGLTSVSDIHNLTTQIQEIVDESMSEDYYTKTEVDELIAEIPTFDPTNYYDKSDVDGLLADKADISDLPDMSNYYTKSETDTALSTKADAASTYNMTQVNNLLNLRLPRPQEQEVQNLPASVVTIANAGEYAPLSELTVAVASGFSGANIVRCGVNLLNVDNFVQRSGYSNLSASLSGSDISVTGYTSGGRFACFYVFTEVGKTYTVKFTNSTGVNDCRVQFSDTEPTEWISGGTSFFVNKTLTFTSTKTWCMLWFELNAEATITELQLEQSNQATAYEPYNGTTYAITFGQTLTQSGVLDCISGVLTLADESTIQCQGVEIDTLLHDNNIYSDTGDILSMKYIIAGSEDVFKYIRMIKG